MKIQQALDENNPFPPADGALTSLIGKTFHSSAHRLRHPAGIYSLSLGKVIDRFSNVLTELDRTAQIREYQASENQDWADRLLLEQDHLLDALMEHFDDCKNVLLCFAPEPSHSAFKAAWGVFGDRTRRYRGHVGNIVNLLKHRQRELAWYVDFGPQEFNPGYYVLAPDESGRVGPDSSVHFGHTAFSFARDLRLHFCGIYHMGDALAAGLGVMGHTQIERRSADKRGKEILEVARRVSLLPFRFFPDEAARATPLVRGGGSLDSPRYELCFPATAKARIVAGGRARVSLGHGDRVCSTFRPPYFGSRWWEFAGDGPTSL